MAHSAHIAHIGHDTTTTHDLRIVIPDDVLGKIEMTDEVRVTFVGRGRDTNPKRLSYTDLLRLMGDPMAR